MGITMQQTLQLLHEIVWGPWTIFLFLWTGLFFTVRSGGFQVRGLSYWWPWIEENTSMLMIITLIASTILMEIIHLLRINVFKLIVVEMIEK